MFGIDRRLLLGAMIVALVSCGPPRSFVTDSSDQDVHDITDVSSEAMDAGMDVMLVDVRDVRDVRDARETGGCDPAACDRSCTEMGAAGGACRMGMCMCFGLLDSGTGDGRATDATDGPFESSVMGCMTNADCPPTMYCSGASCTGPGFCDFRREADAAACGTEGPPSCGCDGVLYPNVCARTVAGVRQDPRGMCARPDAGMDASRD